MEAALATALPTIGGPAIALIIVIYLYLKITNQRKETKIQRDKDSQDIHDELLKHKFEIGRLMDESKFYKETIDDLKTEMNILNTNLVKLQCTVESLAKNFIEFVNRYESKEK